MVTLRNKAGRDWVYPLYGYHAKKWVLALLLSCMAPIAWADSFRCGQKLVRSGDDQSVLLRICGDPIRRDTAQERVGSGSSQKTVKVQRWYYKSSGRKLERVVMIHEGKIIAVRTTGR